MGERENSKTLVFFDGVCAFCNARVDFLLRVDKRDVLRFSPLQGETARKLLPAKLVDDLDTISVIHQGKILTKSEAVLTALQATQGVWAPFATVAKWVPGFIRDWVYDLVAKNRYRFFGKKETCRMPTPEERAKFLP